MGLGSVPPHRGRPVCHHWCKSFILDCLMPRLHWAFLAHDSWLCQENSDCLFVDWGSGPIGDRNFPDTVMSRGAKIDQCRRAIRQKSFFSDSVLICFIRWGFFHFFPFSSASSFSAVDASNLAGSAGLLLFCFLFSFASELILRIFDHIWIWEILSGCSL